jgi:hypothetical protein
MELVACDNNPSCSKTFSFTGDVQSIALEPGNYQIECWGGDGGGEYGGKGGYSKGTYTVTAPTTLYIYVGGQGGCNEYAQALGGWNGGGDSGNAGSPGGGGGGTDVRTTQNTTYANRIIVAGGGGGMGDLYGYVTPIMAGGNGGGLTGADGCVDEGYYNDTHGKGGTQTAGGAGGVMPGHGYHAEALPGSFGVGGGFLPDGWGSDGGGGGGWYGGGAGCWVGGGGGSGYIGGVIGGVTAQYTQGGFQQNPDISGDGFVKISSPAFCGESECLPPTNLEVAYATGCDVELTWDAPGNDVYTYNIYRDDEPIETNYASTTYTDTDADASTHEWCVKVICGNDE